MPPARYHDAGGVLPACTARTGWPGPAFAHPLLATGAYVSGALANGTAAQTGEGARHRSNGVTSFKTLTAVFEIDRASQTQHPAGFFHSDFRPSGLHGPPVPLNSCRCFLCVRGMRLSPLPRRFTAGAGQSVFRRLKSATHIWVLAIMITRKKTLSTQIRVIRDIVSGRCPQATNRHCCYDLKYTGQNFFAGRISQSESGAP